MPTFLEHQAGWQLGEFRYEHLPQVLAIENQVYPFPWTEGIFKDCLESGYVCQVLQAGDDLLGYIVSMVAVGECHILNVCTAPGYRRQGVAQFLLDYSFQRAAELGAEEVFLEVRVSNASAIALYLGLGFEQVGRRKNYYPDHEGREDALVFKRILEPHRC